MDIRMTKEEHQRYSSLTEVERELFLKDKKQKLEKLGTKVTILTNLLVDTLDDIEEFNLFRHRLKQLTKSYNKECKLYLDDLFRSSVLTDDQGQRVSTADYIVHASKAVDEEFEKILTTLTQ